MENLAIYNGINESLPGQENLGLKIQFLKAELKSLKSQKREDTSTIRQLNNTIANQAKAIKDQNKKILKLLNNQQIILNKDKYTFEQFFKLKCKNRTILNHLEKFLNKAPTWDNLTSQNLEQFSGWIRTNAGIKDSSAMNYITQLKNIIKQGYLNSNDTSVSLKSSKPMKEKKIWLKPAELRRVLQYVPVDEDESYVHKLFVICALTGCRIIDAPELRVENIDGYTLRYTPIKTKNKECYVQLSEKVKLIFTHFVQKRVTPTKKNMNDILKNIFRNLRLNRKMEIGTPLNPRIEKICDVVHFHTARYSFATIKYRYSDWTERQIADAIGHADFKMTLENYICDRSPVSVAEKQKNADDLFN